MTSKNTALTRYAARNTSIDAHRGTARPLIDMWLEGKSPHTLTAYKDDARDFGRFLGLPEPIDLALATDRLVSCKNNGAANALVLEYRAAMMKAGAAPATINRRLSSLRSFVRLARTVGAIQWALDIKSLKVETLRDTRGPGSEVFELMLEGTTGAGKRTGAITEVGVYKAARDRAVMSLLYDRGLRRGEVSSLNLAHLDVAGKRLSIMGKGRTQREWITLPVVAVEALELWLVERAGRVNDGDVDADDERLFPVCYKTLYNTVKFAGARVGVKAWPHALRHSAITEALDKAGGDVRKVQQFSRHKDIRTVVKYDDNRRDVGGEIAELLGQTRNRKPAPGVTPAKPKT